MQKLFIQYFLIKKFYLIVNYTVLLRFKLCYQIFIHKTHRELTRFEITKPNFFIFDKVSIFKKSLQKFPNSDFYSFFFFKKSLLEHSLFTMLCQSQVYSKVTQLYIHIQPLYFRFFSHIGHYTLLSSVSCVIQQVLVTHVFYIQQCVYVSPNVSVLYPPGIHYHKLVFHISNIIPLHIAVQFSHLLKSLSFLH